jgi:hypothetical protein
MAGVVVGLFVTVIVLVVLAAAVVRPVNLTLTITDGTLVVEPRGLDVVLAVRRRIAVPLDAVTEVRVVPRDQLRPRGLRLPGTYLPGGAIAGSFGTGEERAFWDVRRGDPLLVVRCAAGAPYRTLVLEFAEPYAVLARIRGALG